MQRSPPDVRQNFGDGTLNGRLGVPDFCNVSLQASDALEPSLSSQNLPRRFFEKAFEASVATTPARWIIGTFAPHLLFSARIAGSRNSIQRLYHWFNVALVIFARVIMTMHS